MNAALALEWAPPAALAMRHLVEDANVRIRLVAARSLLPADPGHARAGAVLVAALADADPRICKAALELVESLGPAGAAVLR